MTPAGNVLRGPLAHHDGSPLYVSTAAPALGDEVELRVRTAADLGTRAVHARVVVDGEPRYVAARVERTREGGETWWRATIPIVNAVTSYRFLLDTPGGVLWLNGQGHHRHDIPDAADFRLTTHPSAPSWTADAVMYQIFPDRFARSTEHPIRDYPEWAIPVPWEEPIAYGTPAGVRQLYGGSLWGVAEHLDHVRALGANTIYLTPFFPARSNHRYDASSFETVDPLLGGDDALHALVRRAHDHGIRVIGDITLNHSGDTHPWFVAGQADPDSPEAAFYYFDEDDRSRYATFADARTLPKFDHRSDELRRRLYDGPDSIVARYLDDGLDGWRVDVAQSAGRHGMVDVNGEVARRTRRTVERASGEALLIAEHMFDASDALQGDGWHGTMAYAGFTRPVWSWLARPQTDDAWGTPGALAHYGGHEMAAAMRDFAAVMPWRSYANSMTLLDSHDTPRFRSVAGRRNQRLGAALLMTLPGMPSIFAGDEVGVAGVHVEDARKPFPWARENWDAEIFDLFRQLIAVRRAHPALRRGGLRWLHRGEDVVVFERALDDEAIVVQVSRSDHAPLRSPFDAESLLGGHALRRGAELPSHGPAFEIWKVA